MRINDPHEDKALGRWIDKVQNLAEGKDNYASNGLVKTQLWASFHIRADTRRNVLPKLIRLCVDTLSWCLSTSWGGGEVNQQRFIRGGNWWIHYGIKQKEQDRELNINNSIMLPCEVCICSFFQLNVWKSDPQST